MNEKQKSVRQGTLRSVEAACCAYIYEDLPIARATDKFRPIPPPGTTKFVAFRTQSGIYFARVEKKPASARKMTQT